MGRSGTLLLLLGVLAVGAIAIPACGRSGAPMPGISGDDDDLADDDDDDDGEFGNAQDGDVTLAGGPVNHCVPLLLATAGSAVLSSAGVFAPGELLLVHQVQDAFATAGDLGPFATPGDAGLWEITRATAVSATSLAITPILTRRYDSLDPRRAQACSMPEYDVATIEGPVTATAWTGTSGGIAGFFAHRVVFAGTSGSISADAAGFRGGVLRGNGGGANESQTINDNVNQAGGYGEGLDRRGFALVGTGPFGNGAGGGGCYNSAGGGGGNAGAGGNGGSQAEPDAVNPATAGRRGGAIGTGLPDRLLFGGGGGAGHQNDLHGGPGGAGGGAAILFAREIRGDARITANGADGGSSASPVDGGGGGGAGGAVRIRTRDASALAGTITAAGGDGGDLAIFNGRRSPGGGGGGGWIWIDADEEAQAVLVHTSGGDHGYLGDGTFHDAQAGQAGSVFP